MKQLWARFIHFLYAHVLHADDTPHRIALGVAIGTFVAITPTPGIQMALTIALAALLRANKVVGLPMTWVSNPLTAVPINLLCWRVGRAILASSRTDQETVARKLQELFTFGEQGAVARFLEIEFWRQGFSFLVEIGLDLWIGCLVVGGLVGLVVYFVTRWGVTEYRQRRRVRKIYRSVMRSRVRQAKVRRRALAAARQPAV